MEQDIRGEPGAVVTVDNGPTLIRYLATTRRWRGALLTLTVAGSTLVHLVTRGGLNVSGVWAFAGWFVGALVARRILRRAQPMAAEDVLAADQAMRGRSLNELAGAALAIGGFLGAASASELARGSDSPVVLAHLVGYLALPALGVLVAVWPRLRPVVVPVSVRTA